MHAISTLDDSLVYENGLYVYAHNEAIRAHYAAKTRLATLLSTGQP